jgi:pimeloyl-ACP methyl ester carboxylesterase
LRLHLRRFGQGGRLTLALHPSLAHGGAFRGLAAQLPGRTFLCPDLPGHGESPDWDGLADLHDVTTQAVQALLQELGPVDLIGHSFGGTVALRLAMAQPALVQTLTLVEPVLFAAAPQAARDALAASLAPYATALAAGDLRAAAAAFQAVWGAGVPLAALPQAQQDSIARRIPLVAASNPALSDDTAGLLCPGALESLHMPVTLIRGADSPTIVAAIHAALMARIPQASDRTVPGAGHMLPITHPDQIAALLA